MTLIQLPYSSGVRLMRPRNPEETQGQLDLIALRGQPANTAEFYTDYNHVREGLDDIGPARALDLLGLSGGHGPTTAAFFSDASKPVCRVAGHWVPTKTGAPKWAHWSRAATQLLFWFPQLHVHARVVMNAHLQYQPSGMQDIRADQLIYAALPLMTALNAGDRAISGAALNAGLRALLSIQALSALHLPTEPQPFSFSLKRAHLTYSWWLSAGQPETLPDPQRTLLISLSAAQLTMMLGHAPANTVRPALLALHAGYAQDWSDDPRPLKPLGDLQDQLESWHGLPRTASLRLPREKLKEYQTNLRQLWTQGKALNAVRQALPSPANRIHRSGLGPALIHLEAAGALAAECYEEWAADPLMLTPHRISHLGQVAISLKERTEFTHLLAGPHLKRVISAALGSGTFMLSQGEEQALSAALSGSQAAQDAWAQHARTHTAPSQPETPC